MHRILEGTSMGKTWNLGPTAPASGKELPPFQLDLSPGLPTAVVTLHGSDLYRMTCQGCHKESGQGSPSEINSVIDPVRATSVAVITERMKAAGREMSQAEIATMAKDSKAMLIEPPECRFANPMSKLRLYRISFMHKEYWP
jgi:hypothetical protein